MKGKEYELFIEKVFKELEPDAKIVQNDFVFGRNTNSKRQIDLTIRNTFLGKEYLTIVQAKDHSRPVDVNVIGAFIEVIKDVNANKGILVSSRGYTKKALGYGKNMGIELLTLHSAQNKNWQTLLKIKVEKKIHYFKYDESTKFEVSRIPSNPSKYDSTVFSYNKRDLIGIYDVINDHILKKVSWKEIKKHRPQLLKFKEIELFKYYDNDFRKVIDGEIWIQYERTSSHAFFIHPDDYVVEVDHIKEHETIRKVTFDADNFNDIVSPDIKRYPDPNAINKPPELEVEIYMFGKRERLVFFRFNVNGLVVGNVVNEANTNRYMFLNEEGIKTQKLADKLKRRK